MIDGSDVKPHPRTMEIHLYRGLHENHFIIRLIVTIFLDTIDVMRLSQDQGFSFRLSPHAIWPDIRDIWIDRGRRLLITTSVILNSPKIKKKFIQIIHHSRTHSAREDKHHQQIYLLIQNIFCSPFAYFSLVYFF